MEPSEAHVAAESTEDTEPKPEDEGVDETTETAADGDEPSEQEVVAADDIEALAADVEARCTVDDPPSAPAEEGTESEEPADTEASPDEPPADTGEQDLAPEHTGQEASDAQPEETAEAADEETGDVESSSAQPESK